MVPEQDLHPLSRHPTSSTATPHSTHTSTQDTTLLSKECQSPVYKCVLVCAHICVCVAHVGTHMCKDVNKGVHVWVRMCSTHTNTPATVPNQASGAQNRA